MEGLIPLVIHAFKKSLRQRSYRSLSDGSNSGGSCRTPMMEWAAKEGSSHHRRTRSEFPPSVAAGSADAHLAPSHSLKAHEEHFFRTAAELRYRRG